MSCFKGFRWTVFLSCKLRHRMNKREFARARVNPSCFAFEGANVDRKGYDVTCSAPNAYGRYPPMENSTDVLRSSVLSRVQQRFREVLTALPRLLADKLLLGNAPADEEIVLGQLRVITGSKYRQYCRAKYGPSYLENLAEKYLSEGDTAEGSNQSVAGRRAVRIYRSLLGLGSGRLQEAEPYVETEGVTTIALPPVAPVLFAFLVWRAGKHGAKLIESFVKRPSGDGPGQDSNRRPGLFDFLCERIMGFLDVDLNPNSQSSTDGLSALELPYLVAFPLVSSDVQGSSLQGSDVPEPGIPPLRAMNPDSSSEQPSHPGNPPHRSLALALELSTPDSVGLQRVLVDVGSPQSILSGESDFAVTDMSSERFQSSMMSAIMRGMAIRPEVLSEHEKGNRSPRLQDDVLPTHELDFAPFGLLLCRSPVLDTPKRSETGSILTEANASVGERDPARVDDGEVLVFVLDRDDPAWKEHEQRLSSGAATFGSSPKVPEREMASRGVSAVVGPKPLLPPQSSTSAMAMHTSISQQAALLPDSRQKRPSVQISTSGQIPDGPTAPAQLVTSRSRERHTSRPSSKSRPNHKATNSCDLAALRKESPMQTVPLTKKTGSVVYDQTATPSRISREPASHSPHQPPLRIRPPTLVDLATKPIPPDRIQPARHIQSSSTIFVPAEQRSRNDNPRPRRTSDTSKRRSLESCRPPVTHWTRRSTNQQEYAHECRRPDSPHPLRGNRDSSLRRSLRASVPRILQDAPALVGQRKHHE